MWKCHKCGKPVYFAERKQSLGYDWHPECLRCEECGKRLNPGQHAEHKGIPYCHVPCYGALFGPQLFGHGTRVESHKSFGLKGSPRPANGPSLPRDHLESKIKVYNQFFDNRSHEIRSREVNDRLVLEGALRVYWGVQGVIHLKEDDDQRTVTTVRKRNSCRYTVSDMDSDKNSQIFYDNTGIELSTSSLMDGNNAGDGLTGGEDSTDISLSESMSFDTCSISDDIVSPLDSSSSKEVSPEHRSHTLPTKLEVKQMGWDEIDDLLQVERKLNDAEKRYQTMPSSITSSNEETSLIRKELSQGSSDSSDTVHGISGSSEEFVTPCSTLKNLNYDEFKRQVRQEYITNANELQTTNADTLKLNQPIDPSRINDSLKLYSEGMMSKSYSSAEQCLRPHPSKASSASLLGNQTIGGAINPNRINDTFARSRNFALQKSGSAISRVGGATAAAADDGDDDGPKQIDQMYQENGFAGGGVGVNRSKSGPNWFYNNNNNNNVNGNGGGAEGGTDHGNGIDSDNCDTLKPSTIRRNQPDRRGIHINMNCYDQSPTSPVSHSTVTTTTTTTATTTRTDDSPTDDTETLRAERETDQSSSMYHETEDGVVLRRPKAGSTAIKRRSGNKRSRAKLKRRCSINGHFYNRETSFFTPPRGSQMSVWITSLVNTQDVINLILEKYKVDSRAENFALFIMRDNGEQRRLRDDEYPLMVRIMLGPHEDVSKLFLTDAQTTSEISCEVAQFLNLSIPECRSILDRYNDELDREVTKIKDKYSEMKRRIIQRMESLKVRL